MYGREYRHKRYRITLFLASFCFPLVYSKLSYTKPDMQPLGPNIADKGSEYYNFRVNDFQSADGARHYRVWTAIPYKPAPPLGYPVLYMLDGNAVMDRLSEALLKQLADHSPPVIVAIGYQTNLPFDLNGRAYDYTPVLGTGSEDNENNPRFHRKTGGGPAFRQRLETHIAPQVEQGIAINPERRGVWGHSYGGLFVLDSWLSSSFFYMYYSASPSLNRDNFALLKRIMAVTPPPFCHKKLIIMEGSASSGDSRQSQMARLLQKVQKTVITLENNGVNAALQDYPGQGHGPMFNVSFRNALLDISREQAGQKSRCN
ncbi:alpha/beta hydrolase [Salmonella enterica]|uniref:Hydrolase n=1 Tax=Salmonella enterica subsp. arizonae TaxID=59203 RepID=A0A379T6J8_SALER|nr:alpha/beta hydrolase [Salmonella enterica]EDO2520082.1 alpha/beta hydrolase [Salmonella enterica subsp. enterica]EDR5866870.1 alpha/beta hydrolase [Salmonella enterica subsp. arizonae serovar 51:z4,z23:-]EAC0103549.1 alpha/beta hydrolase [Salmonella enterica subsp. arizonae]EAM4315196.1 alpha/beta hydrolase [Salmonella enterica]EAO9822152.1 alpha/beta hydrolase [Salmonella enterica]